jgi:hypothetical protein
MDDDDDEYVRMKVMIVCRFLMLLEVVSDEYWWSCGGLGWLGWWLKVRRVS